MSNAAGAENISGSATKVRTTAGLHRKGRIAFCEGKKVTKGPFFALATACAMT